MLPTNLPFDLPIALWRVSQLDTEAAPRASSAV